ncbi:MAG: M1 family aminopeptidase [Planctomycetota bacterium]
MHGRSSFRPVRFPFVSSVPSATLCGRNRQAGTRQRGTRQAGTRQAGTRQAGTPAPLLVLAAWVFALAGVGTSAPALADGIDSPPRSFDVLHMRLEVRLAEEDIRAKRMRGDVTWRFRARPLDGDTKLDEITLNAVELRIRSVTSAPDGGPVKFDEKGGLVRIELDKARAAGEEFGVRIEYTVKSPDKGLYFVGPDADHPDRPRVVYSMSEPLMARHWLPCHDWPDTFWPSDIFISVPPPMSAVSVGAPVGEPEETADGLRRFHWRMETAIDPHMLGFAAGEFVVVKNGEFRGRPVQAYVPPQYADAARYTFRRVPEMLEFLSTRLGVEYPFPQYAHVGVVGHFHGGMEHVGFSMIDPTNLPAGPHDDVSGWWTEFALIAHMIGHQWFGALVNYGDVREAWLNEAFGTYLHECCRAHFDGPDVLAERMWDLTLEMGRSDVVGRDRPLVREDVQKAEEVFAFDGSKVYWKAARVLHMLRDQLGEEVFWRSLRTYLERRRGRGVTTPDLRTAFETESKRDLGEFFEQWVLRAGMPRLDVAYEWEAGRAVVTVQQLQKIDAEHPAFEFPLQLAFRTGDAWHNETAEVTAAEQAFEFALPAEPSLFCCEPRGGLLAARQEQKPDAMWRAQIRSGPTALSRLQAIEHCGRMRDAQSTAAIGEALHDVREYWGTRVRAARALARLSSSEARGVLLTAAPLLDTAAEEVARPALRVAIVEALARWPASREAYALVVRQLRSDPHALVQQAAARTLPEFGRDVWDGDDVALLADRAVNASREVRLAALRSLAGMEAFSALDVLARNPSASSAGSLEYCRQLLDTVRRLAEAAPDRRPAAAQFFFAQLEDPRPGVRNAAIQALGAIGDEATLTQLRARFAEADKSEKKALADAVESIERRLMSTPP